MYTCTYIPVQLHTQDEAKEVLESVRVELGLGKDDVFAISSKTGAGVAVLKKALADSIPPTVVPASYEKLLQRLRAMAGDSPFVGADDAQVIALSDEVGSTTITSSISSPNTCTHTHTHTHTHLTRLVCVLHRRWGFPPVPRRMQHCASCRRKAHCSIRTACATPRRLASAWVR